MGPIKEWEELAIRDNFIFQKVMRKKRYCKRLIEKVLRIKVKKIFFPETEKTIDVRYDRKSVRLDVFVIDERGAFYNIEMQTTDNASPDELPKRTRYYQAMMDMEALGKGKLYTTLPKTYIIFICTFDPFDKGRSIYTFCETCREDFRLVMGDETTKVFLNCQGNRDGLDEDVAAFLDYVAGKEARGSFTKSIAAEVEQVKEHKETRREYMTLMMEMLRREEYGRELGRKEGRREGLERGLARGLAQGKADMVLSMIEHGMPVRNIASIAGWEEEQVRKMAREQGLELAE